MSSDQSFRALLARVRSGDEEAAAALVREYEPAIRRAIRVRLTDPGLRRVMDSVDVCQSVMANFFVRVQAGQFDLDSPKQMLNLLLTMAQNRLRDHVRGQHAERRDQRRVMADGQPALDAVPADQATPSQIVAAKELFQKMRGQLSPDENYLVEQRALGREWQELADELGGTADALRMKLTRALNRLSGQLGLDAVETE
ncbi:MAG: RNA polymerase subunit sigma-24 [Planctomycetia bacterium]|nr:RNA polymerase subunit sigma-24 [Planctomycetia bacterium]